MMVDKSEQEGENILVPFDIELSSSHIVLAELEKRDVKYKVLSRNTGAFLEPFVTIYISSNQREEILRILNNLDESNDEQKLKYRASSTGKRLFEIFNFILGICLLLSFTYRMFIIAIENEGYNGEWIAFIVVLSMLFFVVYVAIIRIKDY